MKPNAIDGVSFPAPIGIEHEPAPSDNPFLSSHYIGDGDPQKLLSDAQSVITKVSNFLSIPIP